MALVTVTGTLLDHNRNVVPPGARPELVFRPNGTTTAGGMRTNREVPARVYDPANGEFEVDLESAAGIEYTPQLRWLVDSSTNPTEKVALGYCEWPSFHPDTGGHIRELWELKYGVGLVLVSTEVPNRSPIPRYQLQVNPRTWDVFERKITWPTS